MKTRISFLNACSLMLLMAGLLCLSGCASDNSPKVTDIATSYTNYHKITAQEVFVNPELAMLCMGVTTGQMAEARKKHGPHAHTAILIYMNDPAAKSFTNRTQPYPVGSVIIKHKSLLTYFDSKGNDLPQPADNGVGGMIKRAPGYDPAHGDWEYFYFEKPEKIESGRIASCVDCHTSAKEKDYVFGSWQKH